MRLPRHVTSWLIIVWSALMVWFYVETIRSNCGNENDCGAAVGLGFLATTMIWLAGFVILMLVRFVGGRLGRWRRRGRAG